MVTVDECNSFVVMPSIEFSKVCKELYSIDKRVNIEVNEDYIKFYIKDEKFDGAFIYEMNDSNDPEIQCKIKTDINIKMSFSLNFLNQISKLGSIGQHVYLYFSQNYPLMVKYKLKDLGECKLYLAPAIEDDE